MRVRRFMFVLALASLGLVRCGGSPSEEADTAATTRGEAIVARDTGRRHLERGQRSDAIRWLEHAARLAPDDPVALVELARALLSGGDEAGLIEDHVRALDLATRAQELDSTLVTACHSRTVALHHLFLRELATSTWEGCERLGVDEKLATATRELLATNREGMVEPWPVSEKRLLEALAVGDRYAAQSIARIHPREAAQLIEDVRLPELVQSLTEGRMADGGELETLEHLGAAIRDDTGDAFVADAVAAVRNLIATSDSSRVKALDEAHRDYTESHVLVRQNACVEARPLLDRARAGFREAASPFELWVSLQETICDYYQSRHDDALTRLAILEDEADRASYLTLRGRVHWMQGLTQARRARYSQSLVAYQAAARTFESTRDVSDYAGIQHLIAETYALLGQNGTAWSHRRAALSRLDPAMESRRRHQLLFGASSAAFARGWPRAAAVFAHLGVASARENHAISEFISGGVRLASYLAAAGQPGEALEILEECDAWLTSARPSAREILQAEIAASRGQILLPGDPVSAVAALDIAIEYNERGRLSRLAELYPLRGRAQLEAGQPEAAERDLLRGIEFFEESRESVFEASARIAYSDVARRVYDEMIRFQIVNRGNWDRGLDYAERARAQLLAEALRDQFGSHDKRRSSLTSEEIRRRTPPGTALVYYVMLENRLLIWVSAAGALTHAEVGIDRHEIETGVTAFRWALETGEGEAASLARYLHDRLIRPVAESLAGVETLVLLPDKALYLVPFAALVDTRTGRYLIEDHRLASTPGATLYLTDFGSRQAEASARPLDALVIGDPAFDASLFPELDPLPGARDEAMRIGELYAGSVVLAGERATRSEFLERLGRHDVIHFAGHALPDDARPLSSRLLLAPSPDGVGEVLARDLYDLPSDRAQLVVLAACGTATGPVSASEGAIGLARPFLASGVPAVVATLWPIDDAPSQELFVRFHREYLANGDPTTALRSAQLAMLANDDPALSRPGSWAGVQLFVEEPAGLP